jgi:uncharacterized protein DUF4406
MGDAVKLIYIAGPYRGPTAWRIESNIRRAEEIALEVHRMGAAALCVHPMTRYYQGECDDGHWLASTLEMMKRCDALMVVPNWEHSSGTREEIRVAQTLGMPVFFHLVDLAVWLETHIPPMQQEEITRVDHPSKRPAAS